MDVAKAIDSPQIDSARHPFELFVLGMGLAIGFPLLFGGPAPGSTAALLGPVWARVWGYLLVLGCMIALVGAWWTWWRWLSRWRPALAGLRHDTGLLIEYVGLVAVAAGTGVYAYGVIQADGGGSGRFLPAALVGGFGAAAAFRVWQINRWTRHVVRAMKTDTPR